MEIEKEDFLKIIKLLWFFFSFIFYQIINFIFNKISYKNKN
jgi:hypothetical protein